MQKTWMRYSLFLMVYATSLLSVDNQTATRTAIILDGEPTNVYFNDGDTFKALDGPLKNKKFRVVGLNTGEAYGEVHQWAGNSPKYLFQIAKRATRVAQSGYWHCTVEPGEDVFGRRLATCNDLAESLIKDGYAHAYSIDDNPASDEYLAFQKEAQEANKGMWKNGTPEYIITSLHSADEGDRRPYNRLISAKDGHSKKWYHHQTYETCEKVCLDEDSCMIYVPFELRYGVNKPDCLLPKKP